MSILNLKYGNGVVTLNVRSPAVLEKLKLPVLTPLPDVGQGFVDAVSYQCIGALGLNVIASPKDLVTIVVRDPSRNWMHQEQMVFMLTYYLHSLGMPYENITVLVACGTEPCTEQQAPIPPDLQGKISVVIHNCDSTDLILYGHTSQGIPVLASPLLRNRKVILLDAVRRDPLVGFSGGPETLIGTCGRSTIEGCYACAVERNALSQYVRSGVIVGNPLCEAMTEIARLINPFFAVYAMLDTSGRFFRFVSGGWLDAWYQSCNEIQQYFGVPINGTGDIVAASCGGYPFDVTLESVCRSLFHAAQTVREGGTIILAAECRDGGPETFLNQAPRPIDPAGLTYLGFQALVKKYRVLIQSKMSTPLLNSLGMEAFRTMETLESKVDFHDKVVRCLPFADAAAPYLCSM